MGFGVTPRKAWGIGANEPLLNVGLAEVHGRGWITATVSCYGREHLTWQVVTVVATIWLQLDVLGLPRTICELPMRTFLVPWFACLCDRMHSTTRLFTTCIFMVPWYESMT
jgi:hypothetical protein